MDNRRDRNTATQAKMMEVPGEFNQVASLNLEIKKLQEIIQELQLELLSLYRKLHSYDRTPY